MEFCEICEDYFERDEDGEPCVACNIPGCPHSKEQYAQEYYEELDFNEGC